MSWLLMQFGVTNIYMSSFDPDKNNKAQGPHRHMHAYVSTNNTDDKPQGVYYYTKDSKNESKSLLKKI